jgi:hypothetical protein
VVKSIAPQCLVLAFGPRRLLTPRWVQSRASTFTPTCFGGRGPVIVLSATPGAGTVLRSGPQTPVTVATFPNVPSKSTGMSTLSFLEISGFQSFATQGRHTAGPNRTPFFLLFLLIIFNQLTTRRS